MSPLHWHHIFDGCSSLDEIHERWHAAAGEYGLNPGHQTWAYHDAILGFAAASSLPAALRLGALLVCVDAYDFDLRLALGALDDPEDGTGTDWPAAFAGAASLSGPCAVFAVCDRSLGDFALGRLAGLRDMLRWNRETHAHWRTAFWNSCLELACRRADTGTLCRALEHGAVLEQVMPQALEVLAAGVYSACMDAPPWTEGRSDADYLAVLDLLRSRGLDLRRESAMALAAAARAGNTVMLEQLVARGADPAAGGHGALVAAATSASAEAVGWLLEHGTADRDALDAALVAAVAALDETVTGILLDAGADIHTGNGQALRTACTARPWELYGGETRFIRHRADMLIMLASHGARVDHPAFAASLRQASEGDKVLADILARRDPEVPQQRALEAAGVAAFGQTPA